MSITSPFPPAFSYESSSRAGLTTSQYTTTTVRLLRLSTNTLLSSLDLLVRTMADFAPDPDQPPITDEELERIRIEANKGESKGIELRGDGKGAGSGQEVQ